MKVVEKRGSHLLLQEEGRFAVVERRVGRIYGIKDGKRAGYPDTPEGIEPAAGECGWGDETPMRRLFDDLTRRGEDWAKQLR